MLSALYVHIPFCHSICPFCSFAVRRNRATAHSGYLEALQQELKLRLRESDEVLAPLQTIYVGGGTPSTLTSKEVHQLMQAIRQRWECTADIEIAFECNPEDVTPEYLESLGSTGITRLSLGGQSFQAETLERLQRNHSRAQLLTALEHLHNFGWQNFNLDLMFGIPQQRLEQFQEDVSQALQSQPQHVSLYGLELPANTPFGKDADIQRWSEETQALSEEMYLWAVKTLTQAGWLHYEVSNFARPQHEGRMNQLVWSGQPYLGIGVGAHSFVGNRRWGNVRSLQKYHASLQRGDAPVAFEENLTDSQRANEFLMLQLRQTRGLNLQVWKERFAPSAWSETYRELLNKWEEVGLVRQEAEVLKLTPRGLLVADALTLELSL